MYVGLNELSLEGQFENIGESGLLDTLVGCRNAMKMISGELRCRRDILKRPVTKNRTLGEWLRELPNGSNTKRALLSWLTKEGPFLDDELLHNIGMTFECNGQVITDSMLAELAHRQRHGLPDEIAAVSVIPSTLMADPLLVTNRDELDQHVDVRIRNHVSAKQLQTWLATLEPPMQSWSSLASRAQRECSNIIFSRSAFAPLDPHPFVPSVAENLLDRLRVLQEMKESFDQTGRLTMRGQDLRRLHFEGGQKPWFSNSSHDDINDFRSQLTFPHPTLPGEKLFCPWHGKVWTAGQWRIHYSDPIAKENPLYVVYVGPKITKR